ncbi:MAG: hypothetical protein ACJ79K_08005 [Gemmatimonadaceae bacterium]
MIKRLSINGQDVSRALAAGEVISQTGSGRWRLTLQLDPNGTGASELLAERVGSRVDVEVHETRGTVLKGAAVVSRFDPLTCYSELMGEGRYTRERPVRQREDESERAD